MSRERDRQTDRQTASPSVSQTHRQIDRKSDNFQSIRERMLGFCGPGIVAEGGTKVRRPRQRERKAREVRDAVGEEEEQGRYPGSNIELAEQQKDLRAWNATWDTSVCVSASLSTKAS